MKMDKELQEPKDELIERIRNKEMKRLVDIDAINKMPIEIEIDSFYEIPRAYEKAIVVFKERLRKVNNTDDLWRASILLKGIKFQDNFKRSAYMCVFEVTERTMR